jgi:ornithine cyclodeaminase
MVAYIGTARVQELVARLGVADFIEALGCEVEADYRRWDEFEKSPRHASHSEVGVIELMPTSDGRLYSFKYVNGHPKNTAGGLLTVTAFGVLADVATGYPLLLSEMTFMTALRTAAVSALAARHLARPNSRVMALIGNGAQSEFQVLAFHRMVGVREVRLFDTDPQATARLMRNLAALRIADLSVHWCTSTAEAVRGADIVTTVTADKPGMHINAVGGDCPGKTELHIDILRRPDARIVVEFEPQARIEGEIQQLDESEPVTELADVLRARRPGRCGPGDVTVFDSVGFALNDFSSLRYLHRLNGEQRDADNDIDLVPILDDPKDLFGGLVGVARPDARAARLRSVDRSFA